MESARGPKRGTVKRRQYKMYEVFVISHWKKRASSEGNGGWSEERANSNDANRFLLVGGAVEEGTEQHPTGKGADSTTVYVAVREGQTSIYPPKK